MGLISNAGDDQDVQQLARRFGIAKYFDFILTSAACSYRKPHRRIFEIALSNWYFLPSEAVMVGDNLDADVRGAQSVGLFTVWISRRAGGRTGGPAVPSSLTRACPRYRSFPRFSTASRFNRKIHIITDYISMSQNKHRESCGQISACLSRIGSRHFFA